MVKSCPVLKFCAGLVIAKHAIAILHTENFVVDSSVVTVLISKVVKLLSEFCDQLVFL